MQNQVYPYPLSVNTTSQFTSQQTYHFCGYYSDHSPLPTYVATGADGDVSPPDGDDDVDPPPDVLGTVLGDVLGTVLGDVLGAVLGAALGASVGFPDDPPPDK